jgi:hypothetical protein
LYCGIFKDYFLESKDTFVLSIAVLFFQLLVVPSDGIGIQTAEGEFFTIFSNYPSSSVSLQLLPYRQFSTTFVRKEPLRNWAVLLSVLTRFFLYFHSMSEFTFRDCAWLTSTLPSKRFPIDLSQTTHHSTMSSLRGRSFIKYPTKIYNVTLTFGA